METRPTLTKQILLDVLKNDYVLINYTKKNGETRIFDCTLREEDIEPYENKTGRHREDDALHITVFVFETLRGEWKNLLLDGINAIYVAGNPIPFMITGV